MKPRIVSSAWKSCPSAVALGRFLDGGTNRCMINKEDHKTWILQLPSQTCCQHKGSKTIQDTNLWSLCSGSCAARRARKRREAQVRRFSWNTCCFAGYIDIFNSYHFISTCKYILQVQIIANLWIESISSTQYMSIHELYDYCIHLHLILYYKSIFLTWQFV